jgi:hypothetical protein
MILEVPAGGLDAIMEALALNLPDTKQMHPNS